MANPVIHRELLGTLRTARAAALQIVLLAVLAMLVLMRWPSDAQVQVSGVEAQQVLGVFGYGLIAIIMLMAPAFPAVSVVREKEQKTLALLLNSPMTRGSILLGKLAGVLGFVVLLLVLSLPAAAVVAAMGGVDVGGQLIPLYLLAILIALEYTALGLWVSSAASSADSALRITYGLVLLLAIISLAPFLFEQGLRGGLFAELLDWLRCLSPIPALMKLMGHSGIGSTGTQSDVNLLGRFAVTSLVLTAVFVMWTALRLDVRRFDRPRPAGQVTDERSSGVRAYRRFMFLWFFDPQRRSGLIGPMTNPVLAKEFRCRRFGRSHWIMRIIGACLIISLLLTLATATGVSNRGGRTDMIGAILVILQMSLLILLTPSLAGGLISSERETGGWQLLQATPLSAWTIMTGKLMSVMGTLLLLLLATLPGYVVMIAIDPGQKVRIIQVLVTLVLTAVFALLLSATVSSMFRRTAAATATAYALLLGLTAGTMLVWLGRSGPFTQDAVQTVLRFNPVAAGLSLIRAPGFAEYVLVPDHWWIMGGICVLLLLILLYRTWRLTKPQ